MNQDLDEAEKALVEQHEFLIFQALKTQKELKRMEKTSKR